MTDETLAGVPLDEWDAEIARESLASAASEIELFDELLILLNHGTALHSGERHDRGLNFLVGLLVTRAFNSLWRGRQSAVEGYVVQAFILIRAALEDWVAVQWLEEHPDEKDLWLCRILEEIPAPLNQSGRERWIPGADQMLGELKDGEVPREVYRQMSKVAHPHGAGVGWQFHASEESLEVHCGPNFNERDLRVCLFLLIHTAAGLLPNVERLQIRWLGEADDEWIAKGRSGVERAQSFISESVAEILGEAQSEAED